MTEPAISSEQSMAGIYKFEIAATQLNQVLKAAVLPGRGAPFVTIEVSTSALKIIAQTKDASFVVSTSAPLLPHADIGSTPIAFEVDRNVIMNTIRHFTGQLMFTFDLDSSSLAWTGKGEKEGERSFCIGARWVPPAAPESGLRPLAVISPDVGGGIRYAATLIGRKEPPNFPYDGVIIEGGSILGGYFCAASRCRSPLLPDSLKFGVPRDHVANAVALCRRLAGKVEVLETDSRIYFRAPNIEGSWNRINQRPADMLNHPFKVPPLQTVSVETSRLQTVTYAMAALFKEQLQVPLKIAALMLD